MNKLPILVSIPHGGINIPTELAPYCNVTSQDILLDGDPHTSEIYDIKNDVTTVITAKIARCFIDLNRSIEDLPSINQDGVLKTVTLFGKKIYNSECLLTKDFIDLLLQKYYYPYHNAIRDAATRDIKLALDCHSMLPYPPTFGLKASETKHLARPSICLGNLGDSLGNPIDNQVTSCPKEVMQHLADSIKLAFQHEDITITYNTPFKGGYITRYHSYQSEFPWIQIELNRDLYLNKRYIDSSTKKTNANRLNDLNQKFRWAVQDFFK